MAVLQERFVTCSDAMYSDTNTTNTTAYNISIPVHVTNRYMYVISQKSHRNFYLTPMIAKNIVEV